MSLFGSKLDFSLGDVVSDNIRCTGTLTVENEYTGKTLLSASTNNDSVVINSSDVAIDGDLSSNDRMIVANRDAQTGDLGIVWRASEGTNNFITGLYRESTLGQYALIKDSAITGNDIDATTTKFADLNVSNLYNNSTIFVGNGTGSISYNGGLYFNATGIKTNFGQ